MSKDKTITRQDVKVGDTIRITREVTIESVGTYGFLNITAATDEKGDGLYLYDDTQIELIKRPLDLPTKVGSFVRVTGSHEGFWILTEKHSVKLWVSASRISKTPGEFEEFITDYDFSFEVIR